MREPLERRRTDRGEVRMIQTGKYTMLKRLGVLMALDAGTSIFETIRFLVWPWLINTGSVGAAAAYASSADSANLYLSWAVDALRLLVCVHTLMSLYRLTGLHKSFKMAQLWYFLRTLSLLPQVLVLALFSYLYPDRDSLLSTPFLLTLTIVFLVILCFFFLGAFLFLSLGNRAILSAGAELLESFGEYDLAKKNCRCGNSLLRFSLALLVTALSATLLTAGMLILTRVYLVPLEEYVRGLLVLLVLVLIVLAVLFWAVLLVFRSLAAMSMFRTYRAIEGLTK